MPDPKDPQDSAKEAANGPGQIGDFIVNGMKTFGEAADKVKNAPGSAVREGKNAVKKGRKLIGLKKGGVISASSGALIKSGFDTMGLTQNRASTAITPEEAAAPTPVAPTPSINVTQTGASGAQDVGLNSLGGGGGYAGGNMVAAGMKDTPEMNMVYNPMRYLEQVKNRDPRIMHSDPIQNMKSGGFIRRGLDAMVAKKDDGKKLPGKASGGFITARGSRKGSRGVGGKRMPKNGVMMAKDGAVVKKTGSFEGQSNKLGYGGRAAQLKAQGVPGGVIGKLARKAQAAPGQKNYHGG